MEVEMLKLVKDSEGRIRYEVNGVMLRENRLPRVGLSTVRHIGSDSYAQKIVEVAPDFSWYKLSTNESLLRGKIVAVMENMCLEN